MNKEKKLIPELRFPEFVKDGDWNLKTLFEVADYANGKAHEKNISENGQYVVVNSKYISSEGETVKYSDEALCLAEKGDTLMVLSDVPNGKAIAKCFYVNEENRFTVNQRICKISPFDCDNNLLYYIMDRNPYFLAFDDGVKQTNLRNVDVQEFTFLLPESPLEQQKIASCLSSLDDLIDAHGDKLEALKDHKKGLMQNLFPQEGQKVPKYRFPEFEGDGEWEERNLGAVEVSGFVNDKIDSKKLTLDNYISTDNMLPDYSGITKATKLPTTNRVTKFMQGDILISNIRPYLKKVWKSDRQGGASNDVLVFRSGLKVLSGFLEFILKNDAFINYVMHSAKGVKMPRGDKDTMLEYPIRLPDQTEQQKIASCLSAVDNLITAQAEKIEQLQQHKKGLMQGLFPSVKG